MLLGDAKKSIKYKNIRFDHIQDSSPNKNNENDYEKRVPSSYNKNRFPIPHHPYRPSSDLSNPVTVGTISSHGTFDKIGKDWCRTNIYKEYIAKGAQEFNSEEYDWLLTEDENKHLYDFVKQRYDRQENCQKIIATFFSRALNTLKELMLWMGLQSQFYKIKDKYNKHSVEDTLKLMIRNEIMFSARNLLFDIFKLWLHYESLKERLKEEWSSYARAQNMVNYDGVKLAYDEANASIWKLQGFIKRFLTEFKHFGKDFILNGYEWISYLNLQKEEIDVKVKILTK